MVGDSKIETTNALTIEQDDGLILTQDGGALPTSDPEVAGQVFTQTAAQLGGTGTTKVICISAG